MAAGDKGLAVLLRNGSHATASIRLALKCEQLSISIARTPIHVATAMDEGIMLDMGINRPSITMSGIITNTGDDETNLQTIAKSGGGTEIVGYQGMESISITGPNRHLADSGTVTFDNTRLYYIPYKNYLEHVVAGWSTATGEEAELEIGDSSFPLFNVLSNGDIADGTSGGFRKSQQDHNITGNNFSTGGSIYRISFVNVQFSLIPGLEDRWMFTMQCSALVPSYVFENQEADST